MISSTVAVAGSPTEIWIAAAPQRLFFKDEFLQSACPAFGTKQTFGPEDFCDAKRRFSSIPQIANPPPPDDGRGHINGRFRELPAPGLVGCARSRRVCAARIRLEPHGGNSTGEGQMDGAKALAVLASIYYPGDGVVAKNNYQTSSGERYDQSASKCAALQWPLGTMLHLVHGRNNIDVTINDHGPYRKGRALDCTPAVDKALHLGGLGSVRVEPYPPLPKARPVEAQVATWSMTQWTQR